MEIRMAKVSYYISIMLLGFWAIIAQIVLLREFLVVFSGNELIFGIIMASWLIGVSIGAISAGALSKRFKNERPLFVYAQIIGLAALPAAIYLIRDARNILGVLRGLMIPFVPAAIFALFVVAPVTVVIGFCFPLAARISKDTGKAYILEGIGSFLGGGVFSFLFAGKIDHFTALFIVSALVTLNLVLMSDKTKKIAWAVSLCIIAMLTLGFGRSLDTFTAQKRLKSINPDMQMLKVKDSRYQNITLARLKEQFSVLSNGSFLFSFPEDYNQEVFINIVMNEHADAKSVLLIGSGIAGELYQLLKYPLKRIDYVELDPELIKLSEHYLLEKDRQALLDNRLSIFFSDGRLFVNNAKSEYDMIIVNTADASNAMLNRFYTKEFFGQIRRIIKKNGVFTIGATSAQNYIGPDIESYVGSIYKTLKSVFPYIAVMPGDRNQFFCALSEGAITTNAAVLEKRFLEKRLQPLYFRPEIFRDAFFPERVKSLQESLERSHAPLNSDSRPISYYYNLILWNFFSDSGQTNIFRALAKINLFKIVLFALGGALLTLLAWEAMRGAFKKNSAQRYDRAVQRINSSWAIFTVGFAAMAFEIMLLFSFQNMYGYVYEMLGLIIAAFMLGMILAAAFCNNILVKFRENLSLILLADVLLIVIFAFTLPFLKMFHIPFIFLAGFLTGFAFPLACRIYSNNKERGEIAAGLIYGIDLLGAGLGVILTATVLVPVLGMAKTCFIVGALNLSSAVLIFANMLSSFIF